jgi:hypothetical protein
LQERQIPISEDKKVVNGSSSRSSKASITINSKIKKIDIQMDKILYIYIWL